MNKEKRERKKELDNKIEKSKFELNIIKNFLKDAVKIFKAKESLEALKEISEVAKLKEQKLIKLIKEAEDLVHYCNHEFLIEGGNTLCLLCGEYVSKYPDTSILLIEVDDTIYIGDSSLLYAIKNMENYFCGREKKEYGDFLKKISKIIDDKIDDENFTYEVYNYIQNYQEIQNNIKTRRLKL